MKWVVEVTHPGTGEELVLGVTADTAEGATASARERGLFVRDCYRSGGGFYKGVRVLAWVWCGLFALLAALVLICGLSGSLATPGNSGIRIALVTTAVTAGLAALGMLVARAMTDALYRDRPEDLQRGFDVSPVVGTTPRPAAGPAAPKQ